MGTVLAKARPVGSPLPWEPTHLHPCRYFPQIVKEGFGAGYLDTCKETCTAIPTCDGFYSHHSQNGCWLVGEDLSKDDSGTGWKFSPGNGGVGTIATTNGFGGATCYRKSGTCASPLPACLPRSPLRCT